MKSVFVAIVFSTAAVAGPAAAEAPGKAVFDRWCTHCHGPGDGHPGTQRLGWRLGEDKAVLERRSDLPAAYVETVVRNGFGAMPQFRVTEISEAELQALAEYLAAKP